MMQKNLTLHETMEIHELLNFKTICMTTSKLVQGVVFDQELKALLDKDVQQSIQAVEILQGLLVKTQQQNQPQ
jgi:similar to spore coat protein